MSVYANHAQEPDDTPEVAGPLIGWDRELNSYRYWRCRRCGLESTDHRLADGCWRCEESDR